MQQHFMIKKRPHAAIEVPPAPQNAEESVLTSGFQSLSTPSGVQPVRSIYTGAFSGVDEYSEDDFEPNAVLPIRYQPTQNFQNHVQEAIQSVRNLRPMHEHISTNDQGSKRAHIFIERLDSAVELDVSSTPYKNKLIPIRAMKLPSSLSMPFPATKCYQMLPNAECFRPNRPA
jgi:hypothetical protein